MVFIANHSRHANASSLLTDGATESKIQENYNELSRMGNINLSSVLVMDIYWTQYSWVSFYDDSLLRPLSSRTEHSRLVMQHSQIKRPFST